MKSLDEKEWREVQRLSSWDHADMVRKQTIDDNPNLDVRLRHDAGQYVIEISSPEKV